jgi:TetR/AcrR family transcriptional regulator, transcriptional repressor for nem operon
MRYPADQKRKAKDAIVAAAGKRLKRQGFNGIGVDGLAAAAGVTSGAFYSNFANKEELLQEMVGRYLGSPFLDGEPGETRENQRRLKAFLLDYLSEGHGRDAENGCVMPALSADVGRAGDPVRKTYQKRMRLLIERMTQSMTGTDAQKRKRAWVVLALMVGTITVARALPDGPERQELLAASLANALKTADL